MLFKVPVKNCVISDVFNAHRDYSRIAPKKLQLHEGIDYAPMWGHSEDEFKVYAAQNGIIHYKGVDPKGYGNFIIIKHSDRYFTWYCHLEKFLVVENQPIKTGDEIGIMGSTGNSTGKHLHFNVQDFQKGLRNYVVDKVVDPLPLMVNKIDSCIITNSCYNVIKEIINV